ncbi:MAG TPA: hypothetical protein VF982_07630, partial [Anaerolineales bacterium]
CAKEAREAELKGRIGDVVDLPSYGYARNVAADGREQQAEPEKTEISFGEDFPRFDRICHRSFSSSIISSLALMIGISYSKPDAKRAG